MNNIKMEDTILEFRGKYRFLSNFYITDTPNIIIYEDMEFATTEHAYQAAKSIDHEDRIMIQMAATPGVAKRLGRKITIREDWNDVKLNVMRDLLKQKFKHPELKLKLLATGKIPIIEGNTWGDTYWGVCKNIGTNYLGKLLMELREKLRVS